MNTIDPTRLARLRPEKFDDVAVKEQISLIQKACGNVDPDLVALVFHECNYDFQTTVSQIQTGKFEEGGWQKAKSNNKKKNHSNHTNSVDPIVNGSILSDSERSLSQRTSPTPSPRGGRHRNDQFNYPPPSSSSRPNPARRDHDSDRSSLAPSIPSSSTHSTTVSAPKPVAPPTAAEHLNDDDLPAPSASSIDKPHPVVLETKQSAAVDSSPKKPASKRAPLSSIPREPVSMHRAVQLSSEPIDIQFGDIEWTDSVPIKVRADHPSPSVGQPAVHPAKSTKKQTNPTSNFAHRQTTNELDLHLSESADHLSLTDHSIVSQSHLPDCPIDASSPLQLQYSSQQSAAPSHESLPISNAHLPATFTPQPADFTSPTSHLDNAFLSNHLQQNNQGGIPSAFTPINLPNSYQSIPRDHPQATAFWNAQSSNFKGNSKPAMIQAGNYPGQAVYQFPGQQQPIFLGAYPYPTLSPAMVQVLTPFEHWPTAGFGAPIESYPYPPAGYIPAYPNQQHPQQYLSSPKHDQYSYDKESVSTYGQQRSASNEQQPATSAPPPPQEVHQTSKLSANAAAFSQGAPLAAAAAASGSTTAFYLNPVPYPMPTYFPPVAASNYQDRNASYASVDNRDNRNGAPYAGNPHRTNYHYHGQQQQQQQQQQQPRAQQNNGSNST